MSATLWIDTATDRAIDLGDPFALLAAFAEMGRLVGNRYDGFAELFGVPDATMQDDDVDPDWVESVRAQASAFLGEFGDSLGPDAVAVLEALEEAGG